MEIVKPAIAVCVNHKYKAIFIHIPKNAGTSIKSTFFPKYANRLDIGSTPSDVDETIAAFRLAGYVMFTVWRMDVIDRFVTAYLEDNKRVDNDCYWMKEMRWYGIKNPEQRFLMYLKEAENHGGFSHCIKQVDAAKQSNGEIRTFDYNFTLDTVRFIPKVIFGGNVLPRKKSNQSEKKRIQLYLNSIVIERICKLYSEDIGHTLMLKREGALWDN